MGRYRKLEIKKEIQESGKEVATLSVRIPESLHRKVKMEAVKRNMSLNLLVVEALKRELDSPKGS